jgi:hypothetical protein
MTARREVKETEAAEPREATPVRNPYILNFCRALVEKNGEDHEPEDMNNLLNKMYELYETMLGKNMINSLPEDIRAQYLAMAKDLSALSYEKIGRLFAANISNHEQIMKDTMKEFAELYMKNRSLNIQD